MSQYLCIAPDLRGFGDAAMEEKPFSMADLADDLVRLLDELQVRSPVVLAGLSMGGYVAFEFLARHPDRVSHLVLMDTRASSDTQQARENRLSMADRLLVESVETVISPMIEKLFSLVSVESQVELVSQWRETMIRTPASTIAFAQKAMASRRDFSGLLDRIKLPTLCVVGEYDSLTPVAEMQQLASAIPTAHLAIIRRAGHLPPIENPDDTVDAISTFLDEQVSSAAESRS